jgi:predicted alpha/beta-hydrolase family hydrolase
MTEELFTVTVNDHTTVSVIRTPATEPSSLPRFVYAPGAGSGIQDPFGVFAARELASAGIETWRFQFPYKEKGRSAPDAPTVLEATWRAVIARVLAEDSRSVVIGGRSMGGRIASMVVAEGVSVAGLALFAYPLLPPGRATSDRAGHFPKIGVPTLFCSGTRDNFATPDQLRDAAALVPDARLHFLEGADHGFAALKASGRTRDAVYGEAVDVLIGFIRGLGDSAKG